MQPSYSQQDTRSQAPSSRSEVITQRRQSLRPRPPRRNNQDLTEDEVFQMQLESLQNYYDLSECIATEIFHARMAIDIRSSTMETMRREVEAMDKQRETAITRKVAKDLVERERTLLMNFRLQIILGRGRGEIEGSVPGPNEGNLMLSELDEIRGGYYEVSRINLLIEEMVRESRENVEQLTRIVDDIKHRIDQVKNRAANQNLEEVVQESKDLLSRATYMFENGITRCQNQRLKALNNKELMWMIRLRVEEIIVTMVRILRDRSPDERHDQLKRYLDMWEKNQKQWRKGEQIMDLILFYKDKINSVERKIGQIKQDIQQLSREGNQERENQRERQGNGQDRERNREGNQASRQQEREQRQNRQ